MDKLKVVLFEIDDQNIAISIWSQIFIVVCGFDLLNCYSLEFLGDQSLLVLSFNIRHRHIKLSSVNVFEKVSCRKNCEQIAPR